MLSLMLRRNFLGASAARASAIALKRQKKSARIGGDRHRRRVERRELRRARGASRRRVLIAAAAVCPAEAKSREQPKLGLSSSSAAARGGGGAPRQRPARAPGRGRSGARGSPPAPTTARFLSASSSTGEGRARRRARRRPRSRANLVEAEREWALLEAFERRHRLGDAKLRHRQRHEVSVQRQPEQRASITSRAPRTRREQTARAASSDFAAGGTKTLWYTCSPRSCAVRTDTLCTRASASESAARSMYSPLAADRSSGSASRIQPRAAEAAALRAQPALEARAGFGRDEPRARYAAHYNAVATSHRSMVASAATLEVKERTMSRRRRGRDAIATGTASQRRTDERGGR